MSEINQVQPPQSPQPPKKEPKEPSRAAIIMKELLLAAVRDWPAKLLALVIAMGLWAFVMAQDSSLYRTKNIEHVKIESTILEELKTRGLIVTNAVQTDAALHADVPQTMLEEIRVNDFKLSIEPDAIYHIDEPGTYNVKISETKSDYVCRIEPATITIVVEEYEERTVAVSPSAVGEVAENLYIDKEEIRCTPKTVTVCGPKSLVSSVEKVVVPFELASVQSESRDGGRKAMPYVLLDKDDQQLSAPLLKVTSGNRTLDSVLLEYTVYSKLTLPVSTEFGITGQPAEGYELKSQNVRVTPSEVIAVGPEDKLALYTEVTLADKLDVSGYTGTDGASIKLNVPTGVVKLIPDQVKVEADVQPIIRTRSFSNLRVELMNCPDNMQALMSTRDVTVVVQGPQIWVDKLESADIALYCDASGLEAGSHELEIICVIRNAPEGMFNTEITPRAMSVDLR